MRLIPAALLAGSLALLTLAPAGAQLMLPGAVGAPPPGGAGEPDGQHPAERKPIVLKPPGEDAVVGRLLLRHGSAGSLSLERSGADLAVTRLTLVGDRISAPGESCRLDVEGMPLPAKLVGRPAGLARYAVALPACPFTFDVLDGALLANRDQPPCEFTAADCRIDPSGLWGPPAASFDAVKIHDMERARLQAETTMRANFRVLMAHAGKNHAAVKAIAAEQAGFSSRREELCRDYAGESVNGFCSLRITEARNHALLAKLSSAEPRAAHGASGRPGAAPLRKRPPATVARPGAPPSAVETR